MVSKAVIVTVLVVLVAAGVGFVILSQGPSVTPSGVKEFTITLEERRSGATLTRSWVPDQIVVKVGDDVKLTIVNSDAEEAATPTYHRFAIKEYNIDSGDIAPKKQFVTEFVATKAGTFIYYDPRPDEQVGNEVIKHSQQIGHLIVVG